MKFYVCTKCCKIIAMVKDSPAPTICCGEPMRELVAGSTDGAFEKHVPQVTRAPGKLIVDVGSVAHPMVENHYIEWVAVETTRGNQRIELSPGAAPHVEFALLPGDEPKAVYAYCNLHGLWKA